jgi:hypothetical protein
MPTVIARLILLAVIAIAISFAAFATYIASKMGFAIYQAYVVSPSWASTLGSVVKSEARRGCGKAGSGYYLDVTYAYQVNGLRYTSSKVWFGNGYCDGKVGVELAANEFQATTSRFVYYDPKNPAEAVLFRGTVDNGTTFAFLLMSAISITAFVFGGKIIADMRTRDAKVDIPEMLKRREQLDRGIRTEIEERMREKQSRG